MDDTTTQYRQLAGLLTAVADEVDPDRWGDPSPCDAWSAADVIRHLVETQRDFLTGHHVDLNPAPDVDNDPATGWRAHAKHVTEVLGRPGVAGTTFDGFFGPTTIGDAIARFYGFDMIVHRWDVARAAHPDEVVWHDADGCAGCGAGWMMPRSSGSRPGRSSICPNRSLW